jgi:hypothetical protein
MTQERIMRDVGKPQYYLKGDVIELGEPWDKEEIFYPDDEEDIPVNMLDPMEIKTKISV